MDFSKLPLPKTSKAPTDPFKIFGALPRLGAAPNDLWRGQAEALAQWEKHRDESDVLISLNTGAGKTLVGLLIAKSFVNEGLDNVLYVCPTSDLVRQTAEQSRAIGIETTTRTEREFDNDLFETGKAFCITTYAALFNGHSALRRKNFPEAVIFDDAHVAEAMMRNAFTLGIDRKDHQALFDSIGDLYRPHFRSLQREQAFSEALERNRPTPQSVLVPPDVVLATATQLTAILKSGGVAADKDLTYPFQHLKDHIDRCAVIIRGGRLEITPPFLPSLALDIFEQRVRRVYLSATLHNKADIIRAFGREPTVVEPANDAGNGERLIVFERVVKGGAFNVAFAKSLAARHKLLVAIPGYYRAKDWDDLSKPVERDRFSDELDRFRKADSGSFILVSRVDGIDLPNDSCRLMIIDGIPRGESLLEKFQFEFLQMRNFAASRIANRLVQLFGRINRGRSDYGAFLISGRDLNIWLSNDRNVALLPDLLKSQILLGRHVQEGMDVKNLNKVESLLDTVLLSRPRDANWLAYYSQFLEATEIDPEKTERARKAEERNFTAAKAEAAYAKHIWHGDYKAARAALDAVVADTARSDEKLAGWLNLWIGACLHHEGNVDDGRYYFAQARGQLGTHLIVDTGPIGATSAAAPQRAIISKVYQLTNLGRESFEKQLTLLERMLAPLSGGSSAQMEEAVRLLGEALGFEASRPDNELGTGPDVLWRDGDAATCIGLELKTDKGENSEYSKAEVSQSLDHLSWMNDNANGQKVLGVVLVGPDAGVSDRANPVNHLFSVKPVLLYNLAQSLLGAIRDAYQQPSAQRLTVIEKFFELGWRLPELSKQLCSKSLK